MAVKTKAAILAEISTLLASNIQIPASDLRTCLNDIVDSYFDAPYKKYVALLTQSGTDAPVATVLENTLSGTPVWSYSDVGEYVLTLAGEFTANKTFIMVNPLDGISEEGLKATRDGVDSITLQTFKAGANFNLGMTNNSIEIRVYA